MNSSFLKTAKFAQFGTMKKKNDFSALWILWGIEGKLQPSPLLVRFETKNHRGRGRN